MEFNPVFRPAELSVPGSYRYYIDLVTGGVAVIDRSGDSPDDPDVTGWSWLDRTAGVVISHTCADNPNDGHECSAESSEGCYITARDRETNKSYRRPVSAAEGLLVAATFGMSVEVVTDWPGMNAASPGVEFELDPKMLKRSPKVARSFDHLTSAMRF